MDCLRVQFTHTSFISPNTRGPNTNMRPSALIKCRKKTRNGVWLNRVRRFARFPARLAVGSPVVSLPALTHFPLDCIYYTLLRPHETLFLQDAAATLVLVFLLTLPLFRRTGLRPRQGLQRCQFLR